MRRLRLLGSLVRRRMPAGSHGLVRRIGIEKARTCLIAFAGRVDRGRSHGRSGQGRLYSESESEIERPAYSERTTSISSRRSR
jgi:hypothetical protein